VAKQANGTTGPDILDVLTMWDSVRRDLNLNITVQMQSTRGSGGAPKVLVHIRTSPKTDTGTPWSNWKPIDFIHEWYPLTGKTFPAFLWFALFDLYSTDFPSDWPRLQALRLPE
jgi:hypothetical protein